MSDAPGFNDICLKTWVDSGQFDPACEEVNFILI